MIDFSQFDSLLAMTMYFNSEDVCRDAIVETRWGKGESQDIVCPYCGQHHFSTRKDGRFRCNRCKRNFFCKVGTIFEDSNLSLINWFIAMYLISSHKKGISSYQLARDIMRQSVIQDPTGGWCLAGICQWRSIGLVRFGSWAWLLVLDFVIVGHR